MDIFWGAIMQTITLWFSNPYPNKFNEFKKEKVTLKK